MILHGSYFCVRERRYGRLVRLYPTLFRVGQKLVNEQHFQSFQSSKATFLPRHTRRFNRGVLTKSMFPKLRKKRCWVSLLLHQNDCKCRRSDGILGGGTNAKKKMYFSLGATNQNSTQGGAREANQGRFEARFPRSRTQYLSQGCKMGHPLIIVLFVLAQKNIVARRSYGRACVQRKNFSQVSFVIKLMKRFVGFLRRQTMAFLGTSQDRHSIVDLWQAQRA